MHKDDLIREQYEHLYMIWRQLDEMWNQRLQRTRDSQMDIPEPFHWTPSWSPIISLIHFDPKGAQAANQSMIAV
jgi:hypothetical protein